MATKTEKEVKTESDYLQEVHTAMQLLKKQNTVRRAKSKVRSDRRKAYFQRNPAARIKQSENFKAFWADPEKRKKMLDVMNSPSTKLKKSESMKSYYYANPEKKERLSQIIKSAWKIKRELR